MKLTLRLLYAYIKLVDLVSRYHAVLLLVIERSFYNIKQENKKNNAKKREDFKDSKPIKLALRYLFYHFSLVSRLKIHTFLHRLRSCATFI
jgi:hypothetical protein